MKIDKNGKKEMSVYIYIKMICQTSLYKARLRERKSAWEILNESELLDTWII